MKIEDETLPTKMSTGKRSKWKAANCEDASFAKPVSLLFAFHSVSCFLSFTVYYWCLPRKAKETKENQTTVTSSSANKKKVVNHGNSSPRTKKIPPPTNVETLESTTPPTSVQVFHLHIPKSASRLVLRDSASFFSTWMTCCNLYLMCHMWSHPSNRLINSRNTLGPQIFQLPKQNRKSLWLRLMHYNSY